MKIHGELTSTPNKYQICCIRCHSSQDLQMIAHREGSGYMVGWIFTCRECLPDLINGGVVVGGIDMAKVAKTLMFLDSLGEIADGADLPDRVHNAIKHYASQVGRYSP